MPPFIPVSTNAHVRAMRRRGSGTGGRGHGDARLALDDAGTGTAHAQSSPDTGQAEGLGTHAGAWPKRERETW